MILKDTLRRIVNEQRQQIVSKQNSVKREILDQISLDLPYAIIISGIRRVGKSTFFNLKKGIILTYNQEDEFHVENKYVEVKPIWKWL